MTELAVVTPENSVAFFEQGDAGWRAGRVFEHSLWPASAPNGEWTMSRVLSDYTALVSIAGTEVPGSRTEPPILMGPRLPHYALPSPEGGSGCYVVPDGRSLSLKVVSPGSEEARALLSAAPVFAAWVGDSKWLLAHHGATLSAFHVESGEQRVLSNSASGFRTPACSQEGAFIAWAEVRDGAVHVMASQFGAEPVDVAQFGGGAALGFRPGTRRLFATVAESPETGVFSEVVALDLAGGTPQRVLRGPIVALWWAPTGDRFTTLHPTYSGDGRFQLRIHTAEGTFVRATEGFIPSNDTATVVSFFDQYALSHPSWSPDGRWFGFAGRFQSDGPHPSYTGSAHDTAWVWDTFEGGAPHALGPGQLVVFGR